MKRFSFGDEEDDEEEDEMEMEMEARRMFPEEFITMAQFGNPGNDILGIAVKVCEKSWLWRFKSLPAKLEMIAKAFISLQELSEGDFNE